jgi:hypothetical protein
VATSGAHETWPPRWDEKIAAAAAFAAPLLANEAEGRKSGAVLRKCAGGSVVHHHRVFKDRPGSGPASSWSLFETQTRAPPT